MGLMFRVNGDVLIPRQDTEILVEEALRDLRDRIRAEQRSGGDSCSGNEKTPPPGGGICSGKRKLRVLDLCTGSGCIAVALAHAMPELSVSASDLSEKALSVAEENAARHHAAVAFYQGDLFAPLTGQRFDLIVSNPPYIPTEVIGTLMPEVRDHEPLSALDGKEDGLYFYRRIVAEANGHLNPGGGLLVEIGCDQAEAVSALMREHGFSGIRVLPDYAGLDRVVCGSLADKSMMMLG
jgi:release factor glutamine methyltransferase